MKADRIYTNGVIYTVNNEFPWATAFAIKDGKFVYVGDDEEIVHCRNQGITEFRKD